MSSAYRPDFISKKKNNQQETKEAIIRDIENGRLKVLNQQHYATSSNNNLYKTAFYVICGALLIGSIWLAYSVGFKTGKSKYKYKRCKY